MRRLAARILCSILALASAIQPALASPVPDHQAAGSGGARALWVDDFRDVEGRILKLLAVPKDTSEAQPWRQSELYSTLAACKYAERDFRAAERYMLKCLAELDKDKSASDYEVARALNHTADCLYQRGKFDKAIARYDAALSRAELIAEKNNHLLVDIRSGITGSYIKKKDYEAAERSCVKLIETLKADGTEENVLLGWAYLTLHDIYTRLGRQEDAQRAFESCRETFRILTRIQLAGQAGSELTAWAKEAEEEVKTRTHDVLWEMLEAASVGMPLITWRDMRTQPWAAVFCLHGLGLHNQIYEPFARRMTEKGVMVFALDVRGFGSWAMVQGQEQVDFKTCIEDVKLALTAVHEINPGIPIFILGESMGGAIALRTAAVHPELVQGLISSVPAADRFDDTQAQLEVAWKYILDPDLPFNIGSSVIDRATADPELRRKWLEDRRVRLMLSPSELIQFDAFMKENLKYAKKIERVPSLVVQGARDKLVKPKSTIELFNKITTIDKDLLIIGSAEHLIFEAGQFSDLLVEGINLWLKGQVAKLSTAGAK